MCFAQIRRLKKGMVISMEIGQFTIEIENEKIEEIFHKISKEQINRIQQVCEQYGEDESDVRHYNVYVLSTASGNKILKKAERREVLNYEKYLIDCSFSVPGYYGKYEDGTNIWILIEYVEGNDLRDMTDEIALAAADSIANIQNTFWNHQDNERFEVYKQRIDKRFHYIKDVPIIGEAYRVFMKRQLSCPRTMSNGDFLEFNAIYRDNKVVIIDWGFGGIMPYSLDIARFIAHATEDRATFPFYMNKRQKELFVNRVYDRLQQKPEHSEYLSDIKLAVLNEYVEFIEADEDETGWYYNHALELAKEILK